MREQWIPGPFSDFSNGPGYEAKVYSVHYGSHSFEGEYYYRVSFVYPALYKIDSRLKFKRESLTPI